MHFFFSPGEWVNVPSNRPCLLYVCHSCWKHVTRCDHATSELKWSNLRRFISRVIKIYTKYSDRSRFEWLSFLKCRSTAARVLRLWVRIPSGYGCLSVVSVVFYQVDVSATSLSLIQRCLNDRGASICVWSRNFAKEDALTHWGH